MCRVTTVPIDHVVAYLPARHVAVEEGPLAGSVATGSISWVYFLDPTATHTTRDPARRAA